MMKTFVVHPLGWIPQPDPRLKPVLRTVTFSEWYEREHEDDGRRNGIQRTSTILCRCAGGKGLCRITIPSFPRSRPSKKAARRRKL